MSCLQFPGPARGCGHARERSAASLLPGGQVGAGGAEAAGSLLARVLCQAPSSS